MMAMTVGCMTISQSAVIGHPQNWIKETIEQDFYLHPTKGWRKGKRRKKRESIPYRDRGRRHCTFLAYKWSRY